MTSRGFELEERLTNFSKELLVFCRSLNADHFNKPLISQLIRSGTSIGANYCEANNASSKKDFLNKIFICKKEAQETKYWLSLIKESESDKTEVVRMYDQCHEFVLIFQKIVSTMKNKELTNK